MDITCKECKEVFVNIVGIVKHEQEIKHKEFEVRGTDINLTL